jgi:hypothetical protein
MPDAPTCEERRMNGQGSGLRAGPRGVEAAGIEPASASAPSVRFYERSSRSSFACLRGPGRREEASPLSVPQEPRDQDP